MSGEECLLGASVRLSQGATSWRLFAWQGCTRGQGRRKQNIPRMILRLVPSTSNPLGNPGVTCDGPLVDRSAGGLAALRKMGL